MDFISNSIGGCATRPPHPLSLWESSSSRQRCDFQPGTFRRFRCTLTAWFQVDFQLSNYTSPAIDLHYFLATSPTPQVYDEKKEFLVEEYWRTLTSCLKEYEYEGAPPTMEELQGYLKERETFALIASFSSLPLVILEKSITVDIDDMLKTDGSFQNPGLRGATYRKIMSTRLPYYEERGLLD